MKLLKEKISINFVINNNVTLQLPHPVYTLQKDKQGSTRQEPASFKNLYIRRECKG